MDNQQTSNLLNIQRASRENRLVVFVGAGVSMNSSIPSWNQLIKIMKKELPNDFSNETDALKIAQIYKDSRGHKEYMDKVKEILLFNKTVPNPLHKSILALNPCHIITTNYDDLIEQELSNEFLQYHIIREDKDIPKMAYPNTLVKMHGDYTTDNIVLTESDYYNYKDHFPLTRAFVQSLFASKLVLFVGFSFADLNLKMILNELQNILSGNMQRAYLLSCEEPTYVNRQYFEKKGINILYLSKEDTDLLVGNSYDNNNLCGIGLHTDKILYAINNYSTTSKKDLAQYLYDRIIPYMDEIRSFGDGLKYFFPKDEKMFWNMHSSGLQTGLEYFKKLTNELKSNQAKRSFLIKHPSIDVRKLIQIAYYNYLYKIDGLEIIDNKILQNVDKYIDLPTIFYIHHFDSEKVYQKLKFLRIRPLSYTIEDLELPYILCSLGDYSEAYQEYTKLLPLYWNKQKYILYFICRYNLWAIRHSVHIQLILDDKHDVNKEIELATNTELSVILGKLPIGSEIKKILQDMISYRAIGNHAVNTEKLKEEIYQQRKSAEKGGCSINNNIVRLMSLYERESLFSWANFIIWENNGYYKTICENNALGILNSFATPASTMFGGLISTKIEALDGSMLESLVFEIENERLKRIIKGYDICSLKFDESGIKYINTCLNGLIMQQQSLFSKEECLYRPLNNLLLLISKSKEEDISIESVYKVIIKYQSKDYNKHIGDNIISSIIKNYKPNNKLAKSLINVLLNCTTSHCEYTMSIYNLVELLKTQNVYYNELQLIKYLIKEKFVIELIYLFPIILGEAKKQVLEYLLATIDNLQAYVFFIYHNRVDIFSVNRFKELLKKEEINEDECFILAEMKRCAQFQSLFGYIDTIAETNPCMKFFIYPLEYQNPEKVKIEWILKFDKVMRQKLFQIEAYKKLLKQYISENNLSNADKKYLINFL